jgi:GST-like protein
VAINPNSKIPAIVDRTGGTGGKPLPVFESGAILLYLANKSGKFLPADPTKHAETLEWLFWQVGGFGPMLVRNAQRSSHTSQRSLPNRLH